MKGEQGRDHRAGPRRLGHALEKQEQQDGVGQMQGHARQMMAGGIHSIELKIQHVGNPGQRMPVAGVARRQRPKKAGPTQGALDVRVGGDVSGIVVGDKSGAPNRCISRQNRQRQAKADQPSLTSPLRIVHDSPNKGKGRQRQGGNCPKRRHFNTFLTSSSRILIIASHRPCGMVAKVRGAWRAGKFYE